MSLDIAASVARRLILLAQRTQLEGAGGFSSAGFAARGDHRPFPQADFERDTFDDLFKLFPDFPLRDAMAGRAMLDLGCGYGGKTVEYRLRCGAARVCGVEPHPSMIERARQYAATQSVDGVEFEVCGARSIPYPNGTFDLVVTHDVLEHVEDPRVTIGEVLRVLRPQGLSVNVFPLYLGALSHHLDYIVNIPGIHWVFSPHTLVRAVNDVLAANPRFGTARQPEPRRSFDGARDVLPGLNGLSGVHLASLFRAFETVSMRRIGLGLRGLGFLANSRLPLGFRDMITGTVVCIYRKR
jgi:SAM-dependent methyltransferase